MKFYLTKPRIATKIDDTGYHPAASDWLQLSPQCSIVALPNRVAAPIDHQWLGTGPDLAKVQVTRPLRKLLFDQARLKTPVRANRLGPALFEAMSLGADVANANAPNPLEPARNKTMTLWFGGEPLHQEVFDCKQEYALETIANKKKGYSELRTVEVAQARKWLYLQARKGFDWKEIQNTFTVDGPPLKPSTVVTEIAATIPVNTWTGYNCTPDFSNSTISIVESTGHRAMHCETGVSDGDHTCTGTVTAGTSTTPLGPAVRMPAPLFIGTKWFYVLYWWSGTWYLRRHDLNNVGNFSTLASASMGGGSHLVEWVTEASGSDISGSHDGNAIGPYTDTNGPDTQLYGGAYVYSNAAEMIPWELSDEAGGGGGSSHTTFLMPF